MKASEWAAKMADVVRKHVAAALQPVLERLKSLEERTPEKGAPGVDGKDGRDGRDGVDGKDADPVSGASIDASVAKHLETNPPAAGRDGVDGKDGSNGKDAEPVSDEAIARAAAAYLTQNPAAAGKDGRDGTDGRDGEKGADAPALTAEQLIDALKASPDLLRTAVAACLSQNPPPAGKDGRDGVDGRDGKDAEPEVLARAVASHYAQNPPAPGRDGRDGLPGLKGLDGKDGSNGNDGFSLDDFDVALEDDGRTVVLSFTRGERKLEKRMVLDVPLYRGVFREGERYARGDSVTFGGSVWIARQVTDAKPESDDSWRLAVKRGRDGRDGKDGRDLTAPVKLP